MRVCRGGMEMFFFGEKRYEMFFPDLISFLRPAVKILFYNYIRDDESSDTKKTLKCWERREIGLDQEQIGKETFAPPKQQSDGDISGAAV